MKTLYVIAALIFSVTAFADDTEVNGQIEFLSPNLEDAAVIDNAEESAEEVKDGVRESGEGSTGQARRRSDVTMKDVSVNRGNDETHTTFPKSKAQDYNSSRPNLRGDEVRKRGKAEGLPTGKRQHRKLDTDDDDDSILTKDEACNAVDNDCDDYRAKDKDGK